MKLYVFNPESDLALANNKANYMAPASARQMVRDLAVLPVWYAEPGSALLAPSAYNADFMKRIRDIFPLQVELVTEPELPQYAQTELMPWGWNPSLRSSLLKNGIPEELLPSPGLLEEYRRLSSRLQAVEMTRRIRERFSCHTCGEHYRIESVEDAGRIVSGMQSCLLKTPWSGSGKGLNWCLHGFTKPVSNWCGRALKEQGCLIAEPIYNKVEDFALEFYSDGWGEVRFAGYSLFSTNDHGAYMGNLLASNEWIEERLSARFPKKELCSIRDFLCRELSALYGSVYTGYLGVDMMLCSSEYGDGCLLHPCVEINMRMNMGVVARLLHDNFLSPHSTGRFGIEYFPDNAALREKHEENLRNSPLVIKEGRMVSGYLPLTPVTPASLYRAYVQV